MRVLGLVLVSIGCWLEVLDVETVGKIVGSNYCDVVTEGESRERCVANVWLREVFMLLIGEKWLDIKEKLCARLGLDAIDELCRLWKLPELDTKGAFGLGNILLLK